MKEDRIMEVLVVFRRHKMSLILSWSWNIWGSYYLAPDVQKLDSAIHQINLYPVDKY